MAAKGGKRGRNAGQGTRKIAKSRWLTFAALIEHSQAKKRARVEARRKRLERRGLLKRTCIDCGRHDFASKRAFRRHQRFSHRRGSAGTVRKGG